MFSAFYDLCSSLSRFLVFLGYAHFPLFFFFFPSFLGFLLDMARPNPTPTLTPNSTPNPTPSASNYKSLYHWAPNNLLEETSSFTTPASIVTYRKSETCHKSRIFGKEHDKSVRIMPCRVGEPVCCDESSDPEGPFCFIYPTVFKKLSLRLPFIGFERALLTEVNVTLAQLHPNSYTEVNVDPVSLPRSYAVSGRVSILLRS